MTDSRPDLAKQSPWDVLARTDVLAGVFLMAVAMLGLWASHDYPVGTALRMGTGYVPRLLCWILLALGALVLAQGLRTPSPPLRSRPAAWRAILSVTAALVTFGLGIERLGLVVCIVLLVAIAALANRALRVFEVAAVAFALIVLSWAIFIFGLGLTIPVWPDW
jgi:putative tricarboxylic transport membrane protein